MRIYAVADIHGRKKRIAFIQEKISEIQPHVLVVAGDLTGIWKAGQTVSWLNQISVPALVILGNADKNSVKALIDEYPNVHNLHIKEKEIQGFRFTGVSGTIPIPFRSRLAIREEGVIERLDSLIDKKTILIAHPPPWGFRDEVLGRFHAGSKSLKKLIAKKNPAMVICGHIHERPGMVDVNGTLVVNCSIGRRGKGAVVELTKGKPAKVDFL